MKKKTIRGFKIVTAWNCSHVLQFLRSVHAAHFEEAEKRKFPGKGRANPFYQKSFVSRTAVVNLLGKRTNNFGGRQCQQLKNKSVID
ncbi:hypothetical protein D918_06554 [Trichuris suis]|nr:hypothetical protein D918_06554 [Trichuris suis]